jgi:hypothetical protein
MKDRFHVTPVGDSSQNHQNERAVDVERNDVSNDRKISLAQLTRLEKLKIEFVKEKNYLIFIM